jgi:SAM-dependent methyltransferase
MDLRAVDLDRSAAMLRTAADHPGVRRVRGDGAALPFAAGTFGLVFFHLSVHHLDWQRALGEARRVLGPGGRCEIWTLGPRHHGSSNLTRWFPSVAALDRARFPDPDDLAAVLASLGFTGVARSATTQRVRRTAASWSASVRAGFVSTLQLLDPGEVERGLAAFVAAHPDPDAVVEYDMYWDRVTADVPLA